MNVSIKEAAGLLGISQQSVRLGLQRGVFDFGVAIKTSSKYTYHISKAKLYEYLGLNKD